MDDLTNKREQEELSSLKLSLGYLLKNAAQIMKGIYLKENEDAKGAEVDIFGTILDLHWPHLFATAQYKLDMKRQEKLRKPAELPVEEDVKKVRDYSIQQIKTMVEDEYTIYGSYEFNRLRALLVSRLTLFNARRGNEPAKLTLKEWNDAVSGAWVDPQRVVQIKDPIAEKMMGKFKLAYQIGKNMKFVPLLIPLDCFKAIEKLQEIRSTINVNKNNPYVFPMTMNSVKHASGWHCVNEVCGYADVSNPTRLTATTMRHRASTMYAMMEVPDGEREAFYSHMGHSEHINKNVYQSPMALQEICQVGSYLDAIDDTESVGMLNLLLYMLLK